MYRDLGIHTIWLPPHSSHFLQMLDLVIFGILKKKYAGLRSKPTRPKLEGKILRILQAWHDTVWRPNIRQAWGRAAVKRTGLSWNITWRLDLDRVKEIIMKHCPDFIENIGCEINFG
jgi:hypothetical protein